MKLCEESKISGITFKKNSDCSKKISKFKFDRNCQGNCDEIFLLKLFLENLTSSIVKVHVLLLLNF